MYDFHYSFIKKHFDAESLFTDTDSLTYEIKSEDVYEKFFKHKHLFDFSNYPKDSKFFDLANEKVFGKIKNKSDRKIIGKFVGLKSKINSMKNTDGKKSNTKRSEYCNWVWWIQRHFNKKVLRHKMRRIQGKKIKKRKYMKSTKYLFLMTKDLF